MLDTLSDRNPVEEQRKYIEDLEYMMGTMGWRRLTEELHKQIYQLQADALEKAKDFPDLCFLRGQAEMLARFISLEGVTAALRDQIDGKE